MPASHSEVVAGIERGLPRDAPHKVVHAADPRRVLLHLIDLVEREFIVDRRLLLDSSLAEFRLLPAVGVLRIFVVGLLAFRGRRRWRAWWQRSRTPVVGPPLLRP